MKKKPFFVIEFFDRKSKKNLHMIKERVNYTDIKKISRHLSKQYKIPIKRIGKRYW